jgi:hypothetical protein
MIGSTLQSSIQWPAWNGGDVWHNLASISTLISTPCCFSCVFNPG